MRAGAPQGIMDITVILCTYNRAQILAGALERVAVSSLPEAIRWEVLVVDNNSNDNTREVVEEFCQLHPGRFRYLLEPHPGKSYALNSGVRDARGKILAFIDDDVMVTPTWLQNLTSELHNNKWAGTGGRTLPAEEVRLPTWLALRGPYALGGVLAAMFDHGDEPCQLDCAPYGANMAFRKQMFDKYGGFRVDLGPSQGRDIPRPNEDTEFGRRVMSAGEHLRYEPAAVAYHPISADRIDKQYFLNWWFDCGRAGIREVGKKPDVFLIPRHWFTIPKVAVTMLVPSTWRWMFSLNPQRRFFGKCWVWKALGQMREIQRRYRDAAAVDSETSQYSAARDGLR